MTTRARTLLWILAGAAVLLAPALIWGRPFVFYDTPAYWGWGRDIAEALLKPWPHPGQPWISGRPLHGWEIGAHGASAGDLRFTLTLLPARSPFYALPFYLLTAVGSFWLAAVVQAAISAWAVFAVGRALVPAMSGAAYIALMAALTALTSLGFEAGYAMPDIFGGLALMAATAFIARPEGFRPATRIGLIALMAYAVLAHTENGLNLAAAALLAALFGAKDGRRAVLASGGPIVAALAIAGLVGAGGAAALAGAFGRPLQIAPFAASRLLADGTAQPYLATACPGTRLQACDLAAAAPVYPEYYLGVYPLDPPASATGADPHLYDRMQYRRVTDAEATQRERFVTEQPRLILGSLGADGGRESGLALVRGAAETLDFGVNADFDSLRGLLREGTQRRGQMLTLTPGAAACVRGGGRACGDLHLGALTALQGGLVFAALGWIVLSAARSVSHEDPLRRFGAAVVWLFLANALCCGALSGVYDRYQTRIAWLIPLCALLAALRWALAKQGRAAVAPAETIPSRLAPIVGASAAVRRP